jgi:hypothetical protein
VIAPNRDQRDPRSRRRGAQRELAAGALKAALADGRWHEQGVEALDFCKWRAAEIQTDNTKR